MTEKPIKEILVLGSSSLGWVVSYMLMSMLGKTGVNIKYIYIRDGKNTGGIINSVSNFSDIFQLLSLVGVDLSTFFKSCLALPFVGYRYSHVMQGISFVHSFSGYDKSYGRRISDDVIPFLNKAIPGVGYEDFSLSAQMAESGRFFGLDELISNPSLLAGSGVSFSEEKFIEMLTSVHSEKHFEYFSCQNVVVDFDSVGSVKSLLIDNVSLAADLYLDCTGSDRKIISYISDVETLSAIGFSRVTVDDQTVVEKPFVECHISVNGLLKKERIVGLSQISEYKVGDIEAHNFTPYITSSSWINNVVAIGDASGSVCNIVLSELDLAINQVKLLVESFPRSSKTDLTKIYFNKIVRDQLFWLYQFNWLAINFNEAAADYTNSKYKISKELSERLLAFKRTGFVFTDNNEIFSDLFWKSFLLGNKFTYDGGFDCFESNVDAILDLLKEKVVLHKNVNNMTDFREFYK